METQKPSANDSAVTRLLIIDDETAQMKALCDTLQDQGYITTGFTSAKAALAVIHNQSFDLVLTDLMMPEMDGIAFLQQALEMDANLVGIIMTGEGTIATAVQAMKAGAFDYILKPFKLSIILPVLSRALAVKRLRQKNAELEKYVRERTAQIEAANKDLEAFSYSVSHDLRSPLRHIQGYANMLATGHADHLPPEAQQFLKSILTSTKRMAQLIDDLLRLSRLDRQSLSKHPVDLSSLVREVMGELENESAGRSVDLRIGEQPDCFGDRSLLKQVYINLISNALKFTRHRQTAIIEIGWQNQTSEGCYFVRDNGAGFNMPDAKKLFGVFQRLHDYKQFEGTGVGLSIVQRIILRHGGRIWAEAEVDKGATLWFTLPTLPQAG